MIEFTAAGIIKRPFRKVFTKQPPACGKSSLKGFQAAFLSFRLPARLLAGKRCYGAAGAWNRGAGSKPSSLKKSSLKSGRTFQAALGLAIGGAYSESGLRASMVRLPVWSGAETMPSASSWSNSVAALL